MSKKSQGVAALSFAAVAALAFTACAPGGPAENGNGGQADQSQNEGQQFTVEPENTGLADLGDIETADDNISFSVGEGEYTSYNVMTPQTYSTYGSVIADRMFSGFNYYGTDGELYMNEDMGTYEVESEDPLVVKYTINEDAVWSDGTPVTAADYIFDWGVNNPRITIDDEQIFNPVSATLGEYVTTPPEGDPNGKEFTLTFDETYADWELLVTSPLPVHVVADQTGSTVEELVEAVRNEDAEALQDAAEFWNNGWVMTPGELLDEELTPSMGPYKLGSWEAGQSLTPPPTCRPCPTLTST